MLWGFVCHIHNIRLRSVDSQKKFTIGENFAQHLFAFPFSVDNFTFRKRVFMKMETNYCILKRLGSQDLNYTSDFCIHSSKGKLPLLVYGAQRTRWFCQRCVFDNETYMKLNLTERSLHQKHKLNVLPSQVLFYCD